MASIEERVEGLLEAKVQELGYELYDVEYAKEGPNYFLRIFIDKPEGIAIEDCERVNNEIDPMLEEADYIKDAYFLEVSSPGVERILRKDKHLKANIENKIEVHLFQNVGKKKVYIGILKEFNEEEVIIETEEGKIELPRKNIAMIKTVYDW